MAGMGGVALQPPQGAGDFQGLAAQSLLRLDGSRAITSHIAPATDHLLIYFGAAWCGPCRVFLPKLKEAYPTLKRARRQTEVVYVGDDHSPAALLDYAVQNQMPWLIAPHAFTRRSRLLSHLRGKALPGLVLMDRAGRVLETSWRTPEDSRPNQALERSLQRQ